jgi:hypothetical protein
LGINLRLWFIGPLLSLSIKMSTTTEQKKQLHPAVLLLGLVGGLAAILVVLLALFILPSLKSGPHDLPIGLVGNEARVESAQSALQATMPGAFIANQFATQTELEAAIRARKVVGGLIVEDNEIVAVVASAGSAAISGTLVGAANQLAAQTGIEARVSDIVPLPAQDPQGIGIGGLAFPLVFGGIVPVVAFKSVFPKRNGWRLAGIVGFAIVGGLVVAAVLQFWFGSVSGVFLPVAAAMALGIAGLALPLAGLQSLFGGTGFTIGAMTMMFLGNPLAGIATTGDWLPKGLGLFGQLLPPGATGTLVRSSAYFEGAGAWGAINTLVVWIIVGIVLTAIGLMRERQAS